MIVLPACGKRPYPTRAAAKHAAHRLHPNEHLRAYRCETCTNTWREVWHFGHLPLHIRHGH